MTESLQIFKKNLTQTEASPRADIKNKFRVAWHYHSQIKPSDWLFQVSRVCLTNQIALFQRSIARLL